MDVLEANIVVHTKMADTYNTNEPHFRPENKEKVAAVLRELRDATGPSLLDIGCGTGFIIDLARDLFDEIHGVDITRAMLDKIDLSAGNITLHNANAASLPFEDGRFDVVTAYAFLHHLEDYRPVLKEVNRVLKPGGLFYADLEPNALFWDLMMKQDLSKNGQYSDLVTREYQSVFHTDQAVYEEYGIEKEVFNKAEHLKSIQGGIKVDELCKDCEKLGFSQVEATFQWFAGQGKVMHGQSYEEAAVVERYLREILPLSKSLFKYFKLIAQKTP